MSIAAISSAQSAPISPERAEGAGPEHDGDSDDSAVQAPVQAALPPGTGTVIDTKA
jgi:hypothetical protein